MITLILFLLLLLQSSSGFSEVNATMKIALPEPDGKYCAMYGHHLVECNVKFDSAAHTFDFYLLEFSEETRCSNVNYIYNADDKSLNVPDLTNRDSCVGKQVDRNKADVKVSFIPEKDALDVHVNSLQITMNKC
ncbi:unnamed protein product [Phytomonas sp. Hart1]|nr:unnamed protein product [Phytomonas sp. Hart1]|eukprot:CCW69702.1 unnamed protein product [Phytomonas sp. isolate Hart1]